MKTSLKIFLLAVALIVMSGCWAQRRAERHIRKAVALCPEMVQTKAHPIDTVLTAPGYADCTAVAMGEVLKGQTLYAPTNHGTIVVKLLPTDSVLRVGFVAAPQPVRYRDTISYAQVVTGTNPKAEPKAAKVWRSIGFTLLGIIAGIFLVIVVALKTKS